MAFDFEMNCIENIGATTTITIDDGGVIKFRNSNSNMYVDRTWYIPCVG